MSINSSASSLNVQEP